MFKKSKKNVFIHSPKKLVSFITMCTYSLVQNYVTFITK